MKKNYEAMTQKSDRTDENLDNGTLCRYQTLASF